MTTQMNAKNPILRSLCLGESSTPNDTPIERNISSSTEGDLIPLNELMKAAKEAEKAEKAEKARPQRSRKRKPSPKKRKVVSLKQASLKKRKTRSSSSSSVRIPRAALPPPEHSSMGELMERVGKAKNVDYGHLDWQLASPPEMLRSQLMIIKELDKLRSQRANDILTIHRLSEEVKALSNQKSDPVDLGEFKTDITALSAKLDMIEKKMGEIGVLCHDVSSLSMQHLDLKNQVDNAQERSEKTHALLVKLQTGLSRLSGIF